MSLPPPPPRLEDLRYGTRLRAGLGYSTVLAEMDFETYSEAGFVWDDTAQRWACLPHASQGKKGITVVGSARYAEHPTTEVLCLAYDLKDGRGRRLWKPGMAPPQDLFDHISAGLLIEAWNASFERDIWEKVCVSRMGWLAMPRRQWRCAMAKARAHNLPGKLDEAGKVLRIERGKLADGKRLLNLFSIPRNPTKADSRIRIRPEDHPEGTLLYEYCLRDIEAEAEISSRVPDQDPDELEWWLTDQEINARGVQIDTAAVAAYSVIVEEALARGNAELREITAGAVEAASQIQRLSAWLASQGHPVSSLDEEHVEEALARPLLPPHVRRALEIRAAIGSASVKKLYAIANQVCADGRLRGLFTYHGARTGRTTGGGPQPTNLPKAGPDVLRCTECKRHYGLGKPRCPWCGVDRVLAKPEEWSFAVSEDARVVLATGSPACVEVFFDDALPVVSGCLRGLFCAASGRELVSSDYNSIEAVSLAELAGEEWRREVFHTHGKIYEMSASKITGIPFEEYARHRAETGKHHPTRSTIGKVAELASGYQGWIGAWKAFGADEFFGDEEIKQHILAWRAASPRIVEMWGGQTRRRGVPELFGIEGAAVAALLAPGSEHSSHSVTYVQRGDVLYCVLPSGRPIAYHRPRLTPSDRRPGEWSISYEGWNSNPKNGPMGWIRMYTWGGRLVENINQAICRDVQRHGLVALERAGYPTVLHVYDENIAEVSGAVEGGQLADYERIMADLPAWCVAADGRRWPIRASGGWTGQRFRKD